MSQKMGSYSWADDSDEESEKSVPQYSKTAWEEEPVASSAAAAMKTKSAPIPAPLPAEIIEEEPEKEEESDEEFEDEDLLPLEEVQVLSQMERCDYEIQLMDDPESKIFVAQEVNTICNYDLTPLLKSNFPNPSLMESIALTFSDYVYANGIASPLRQKFFAPLTDSMPNQSRYVITTESGVSFNVKREEYQDFSEDVIHQYFVMRLIQKKIWKRVPMISYPFGVFSATKYCEYTGDAVKDADKLYNFLISSYIPFNRTDDIGKSKSNNPGVRQLSFHVAMAPPRIEKKKVKPLLSPPEAWYLLKMMNSFLWFAGSFYNFSHGDAHYHNWFLRDLGEVQKIEIPDGDADTTSVFYTRYLPVLAEFGRSSLVYGNERYAVQSKYYAVPPKYDFVGDHDLLQLMYGFVKDLDNIYFNPREPNQYLRKFFQGPINRHSRKYRELVGFDIVSGREKKGTSFAEMARMLSNKREIVDEIFESINKEYGTWVPIVPANVRPLRPSTEKVKTLGLKCPPMPRIPAGYKNSKTAEQATRDRSERIIYLREEDEDEDIEDVREMLFDYMKLSIETDFYDSKEGLIVENVLKRLANAGITYKDGFTEAEKKIYDDFAKFKARKDQEQRERKRDVMTQQIGLAGPTTFEPFTPRTPGARQQRPDSEGFKVSFGRRR